MTNISDYLYRKASINRIPLNGTFELSPVCNFNCKMCYIHRSPNSREALLGEKDTAWWLNVAREARSRGMLLLLLTGGEPMLRPDFDEIYRECKKLGLLVSVNTNATLIDEDKLRLFYEYPPHKVSVTLYGALSETYGKLCGNPSAYQKVVDSIYELKKAGVNLKLNYSITPDNVADIPAVTAFIKELGVPAIAAFGAAIKALPDLNKTAEEIYKRITANIPGVKTALYNTINVYDILNADKIVITEKSMPMIENWLLGKENA